MNIRSKVKVRVGVKRSSGRRELRTSTKPRAGSGSCGFFVRIDAIHFLAGCRKRRLNQGYFGFVRFSFWGFLCIFLGISCINLGCCRFVLSLVSIIAK